MESLTGAVRSYAWGSRHALARLLGQPEPSPAPEAELWLGDHPGDPSRTARGRLDEVIATNPIGILGHSAVREFGPRLPFLLKVLAAAQPLSLQVHPDAKRAAPQFEAGNNNYVDNRHKPELLVALDDFQVLCGFREPAVTAELLSGVPPLANVVRLLRDGDLQDATTTLLTADPSLVAEVLGHVDQLADHQAALLRSLTARYPTDRGALLALLLNHLTLAPGQAIFMPAGNLHAYLHGYGIEVMASSDNVIRCGLTPKHVDIPELLNVLDFRALAEPLIQPTPAGSGITTWPTSAREFMLHRIEVGPQTPKAVLPGAGPRIVVCVKGHVIANDLTLHTGTAAFAAADQSPITVTGAGTLFQASTPFYP